MPLATDTLTTHIIAIISWWKTYRQRLLFLLDINQLDFTAGCWVHFSIWIRFTLYIVHVVLINQNSHHIISHHNLISLPHSDLLLPFLASTQRCSHTVHRPNINRVLSLHAYHFISVPQSRIYSQSQDSNCCVQICDTNQQGKNLYSICPFSQTYLNLHGHPDVCLIKYISYQWTIN